MTTYYCDFDGAGGTEVGTTANPWHALADAIAGKNLGGTVPVAGDIIYCRGTDTTAATTTNALNGDETGGLIKWIGCSGTGTTWTNDGTRAIIDGNGGNYSVLTQNGAYNLFENFGFTGSGNTTGVAGTGDQNVYVNCAFYGNGTIGYQGNGMVRCQLIRCVAYGNTTQGFSPGNYNRLLFCCSHDNGTDGYGDANGLNSNYIGCLGYDNGDKGWETLMQGAMLLNCTSDTNVSDNALIYSGAYNYVTVIIGSRFTNAPATKDGIDMNTEVCIYGWNYFGGNANDITNSTLAYALTYNGAATNTTGGSDTNHGYTHPFEAGHTDEDYNLRSDATLRRTAITIPTS